MFITSKKPLIKAGKLNLILNSLIFLTLISLTHIKNLEALRDKVEADILGVNQEMGFFIISAGGSQGLNIGDRVAIFDDKDEIGKGQIIEVREEVSAVEVIEPLGLMLKEGYRIEVYPFQKLERQKAGPENVQVLQPREGSYGPSLKSGKPGELVNMNINSEFKKVFPFALQVLRSKGYSVNYSNRFAGLISATKGIGLSLPQELWADFMAAIDHKVLLRLNIKKRDDISNLSIAATLEHTQKGRRVEGSIWRSSGFYNEILKMAGEIKRLAEAE